MLNNVKINSMYHIVGRRVFKAPYCGAERNQRTILWGGEEWGPFMVGALLGVGGAGLRGGRVVERPGGLQGEGLGVHGGVHRLCFF